MHKHFDFMLVQEASNCTCLIVAWLVASWQVEHTQDFQYEGHEMKMLILLVDVVKVLS